MNEPARRSIDVALTGVDGQSRTHDDMVERSLQVRYDQKMAKYGQVAERNGLRFIPAVFSHTGQIHEAFKILKPSNNNNQITSYTLSQRLND